jgi:hypothetical protein
MLSAAGLAKAAAFGSAVTLDGRCGGAAAGTCARGAPASVAIVTVTERARMPLFRLINTTATAYRHGKPATDKHGTIPPQNNTDEHGRICVCPCLSVAGISVVRRGT